MAKANPTDFLLNTDYELDKIILFEEGNFTSTTEIQHNLDFIPLAFGIWSLDQDFNSTNPIGAVDTSTEPGYVPQLSVECSANSTSIKLTAYGNTNNQTIYYRLYAFESSDSKKITHKTSGAAQQFILNTEYNYCKLLKEGFFTQAYEKFEHNLGYIPQVMAWVEYTGTYGTQPLMLSSEYTDFGFKVTDKYIQLEDIYLPGLINKVYWRLYYDEG